MIKGNVPLFDETVDAGDPADAGKKFAGMAFGAAVALGAIAAGNWALERVSDATGVEADGGIPVAGGN